MSKRQIPRAAVAIGLIALAGTAWECPARAASTTYLITATTDSSPATTGLSGASGSLDFQFDPIGSAVPATAVISDFSVTGGMLVGSTVDTNDAIGTLPGTVTLGNSAGYNDASQQVVYGTTIRFSLTLTASGSSTDGTTFSFTMFDSSFNALSTGPSGEAVDVTIFSQGAAPTITGPFGPVSGSYPTVTITAAIPEPSSIVLLGLGLGALAVIGRSRERRA